MDGKTEVEKVLNESTDVQQNIKYQNEYSKNMGLTWLTGARIYNGRCGRSEKSTLRTSNQ